MSTRYRSIMMALLTSRISLLLLFVSLLCLTAQVQASGPDGEESSLPNGVAAGDVTQDSAVLWAHSTVLGSVDFTYSTNRDFSNGTTVSVNVTNTLKPAKVTVNGLTPNTIYYYRATNAAGESADGRFQTAASTGHYGLRFGVSGDWRGELSPYPSISNASERNLNFFIEHGDTIYADVPSPAVPLSQAMTLADFRNKHNEVYSSRFGLNSWAELRASTSILATIDDHEVMLGFSGGADADSDARFDESEGFINDTQLYENGLQAFHEYNPLRDEFYGQDVDDGDGRMDGEHKLYRYQTYGSDAAVIILDTRSFRDEAITPIKGVDVLDIPRFLTEAFEEARTMLGQQQLADLKADLLNAQQEGITWKFILTSVPIQNFNPFAAEDRFEGYAAERREILQFIHDNNIENVVFIASSTYGTTVNNLFYQQGVNQPQIETDAFEISTGPLGHDPPLGPGTIELALAFGLLPDKSAYDALPIANDPDDIIDDKDDFVKDIINQLIDFFEYDRLGLEGSQIEAQLAHPHGAPWGGDYLAAHTFGWTEFEIDQDNQQLTVTTFGISPYTEGQLNLNPSDIMTRSPEIVSQFIVTPTGWITVDVTLSELNTSSAKTPLIGLATFALLVLAGVAMRRWE